MNNLVGSAITFSEQLGIDPISDFNRHHRRRFIPKKQLIKIQTHSVQLIYLLFYRVEFKKVQNSLLMLLNKHLKKCLVIFEPIYL